MLVNDSVGAVGKTVLLDAKAIPLLAPKASATKLVLTGITSQILTFLAGMPPVERKYTVYSTSIATFVARYS